MIRRAVLAVALLSAPAPVFAEQERPWAVGVPEDRQSSALATFRSANDAFAAHDYMVAVRLYREALAAWDHPAIRGNLAVALIQLDQPVEAYHELERAFAFGAAPFEPTVYSQLQTNRKLLAGQIARIEIAGQLAGATIVLDGNPLPKGGVHIVRAGTHELVARKPGAVTFSTSIVATSDRETRVNVVLVPLEEAGRIERRFARWKPWTVLGGGAALTLVGVGFQLAASDNIDSYESEIARACPNGCAESSLSPAVLALPDRARWQNRVGVTSLVVGGAAVATGAVLLYLNQPVRRRVDESGRVISIVPTAAPGFVGATAVLDF